MTPKLDKTQPLKSATPSRILQETVELNDLERELINLLQLDFPITERPFLAIAEQLNQLESQQNNPVSYTEQQIVDVIQSLLDRGILTRFGPLFDISRDRGYFSLCALKVSVDRIDEVTEMVNAYPAVAHNYLRAHEWNMWFVLAAESQQRVEAIFDEIVERTGCAGMNCPKKQEFFVGLYLEV